MSSPTNTNFMVSSHSDFSSPLINYASSYTTTYTASTGVLTKNVTLYSKVQHVSDVGSSAWSSTRMFSINSYSRWLVRYDNLSGFTMASTVDKLTGDTYLVGFDKTSTRYNYIGKFNKNGESVWQKFITSAYGGCFYSVVTDGTVIYAGGLYTNSSVSGYSYTYACIVKLNMDGTVIWNKYINVNEGGLVCNLCLDKYGSLYFYLQTNGVYLLCKYDNSFAKIWAKQIDSFLTNYTTLYSYDNVLLDCVPGGSNSFLYMYTLDGVFLYGKYFYTSAHNYHYALRCYLDSSHNAYLVGYYRYDINSQARLFPFIIKYDLTANTVVWMKSYDLDSRADGDLVHFTSLTITSDDKLYVIGNKYNINSVKYSFVINFDSDGNILWQKKLPGYYETSIDKDNWDNLFVSEEFTWLCGIDPTGTNMEGAIPSYSSFSWVNTGLIQVTDYNQYSSITSDRANYTSSITWTDRSTSISALTGYTINTYTY